MRFRLGVVAGLAVGYYLGARAGRRRYDQINRSLTRLRETSAFEQAAERAKAAVGDGVEAARGLIDRRGGQTGDHTVVLGADEHRAAAANGSGPTGIAYSADLADPDRTDPAPDPTDPPAGLGGYSSSR